MYYFLDERKRDLFYMLIHFKEDVDCPGLKYFKEAKELFFEMAAIWNIGRTKERFFACKQTVDAIR